MKLTTILPFTICIALIASGVTIGGRDGAIMCIVGAAALVGHSIWMALRINSQK